MTLRLLSGNINSKEFVMIFLTCFPELYNNTSLESRLAGKLEAESCRSVNPVFMIALLMSRAEHEGKLLLVFSVLLMYW
jgi:hypothetical protein